MEVQSQFIEMFDQAPKVKLGDYITTQSGGTPNTKKTEYYEGGDIPWLSSGEVNQGYITSTEKFITQIGLDNSSAKWTPKDCVVIAMYGATAGKVGFVKIPLTTNQAVCTLLPCDNFKPIFLYYAVSQKTDWMISKCQGAAQPNISQGIIRSMELPLPSMDEQDKFVSIAEQADKSKFVGFKSQFIEMFGDKQWKEVHLEDVVSEDCSLSYGIVQPGEGVNEGIPVVRPVDLITNIVEPDNLKRTTTEIANAYKRTTLRGGELLLCVRGTTGVLAMASNNLNGGNVTRGIVPIWFRQNVSKSFMFYLMKSDYVQKQIKDKTYGTTLLQINIKDLRQIKVILPPDALQQEFIAIAEQADKSKYYNQTA